MPGRLPKLPTTVRGKHYVETKDWTEKEIDLALRVASDLKKRFTKGKPHRYLPDKTVFLFFFDKSTRTRNSFEAGATQLGAHAHFISAETSQAAHGESPKDMGIILSSYGHAIAIRHDLVPGEGNAYMREVARNASVPVLNMQCDIDHPFQTLADLMTIREEFGNNLRGLKIAVSWAYAPSYAKPMSVPQGLITLMTRFGLNVTLAHPPDFALMKGPMKYAEEMARKNGTTFQVVDTMEEAFKDADIVYPKSWGIESLFHKPQEALEIAKKYPHWICDEQKMKLIHKDGIYMHCLPADRGFEVTDAVIDGPRSRVFPEASNRLHT
ncbi:MAG: ornithine carbamoyltransferase, partial [Ignavibacteria bacterium]|nr:ornithine carbamoyltransferase [Ignavibacteria bacterium]